MIYIRAGFVSSMTGLMSNKLDSVSDLFGFVSNKTGAVSNMTS